MARAALRRAPPSVWMAMRAPAIVALVTRVESREDVRLHTTHTRGADVRAWTHAVHGEAPIRLGGMWSGSRLVGYCIRRGRLLALRSVTPERLQCNAHDCRWSLFVPCSVSAKSAMRGTTVVSLCGCDLCRVDEQPCATCRARLGTDTHVVRRKAAGRLQHSMARHGTIGTAR